MAGKAQRFDSRQSMNNKSFEVFHYREKKTDNIGLHHHDFFEVYFFLGGHVDFRVEGKSYQMEPGDLLLINPQELHQAIVSPDSQYERIILWIDKNYLSQLSCPEFPLSACFDNTSPGHINLLRPDKVHRVLLQDQLEKLTAEFYGGKPGSSIYAQGLLMQFLVELNRLSRNLSKQVRPSDEPDLISRVLSYIGSHFQEQITLESLAAEFYVSKFYLSHEFRRRVGTSVYRYILFRRLLLAKELMEEGKSPGAVYQSCGFGDYANFYRVFKAEYGISPSEYCHKIKLSTSD